jgi:hypothetical protein
MKFPLYRLLIRPDPLTNMATIGNSWKLTWHDLLLNVVRCPCTLKQNRKTKRKPHERTRTDRQLYYLRFRYLWATTEILCIYCSNLLFSTPNCFWQDVLLLSFTMNALNSISMLFILQSYLFFAYCCSMRFQYQTMFVWFNSNTTGATSGAGTNNPPFEHECTPIFVGFVLLDLYSFLCIVV